MGLPDAEPPRDLKQVVREFVELGVPGRRVLVMQASGQLFPATFRLSRKIDTFQVSTDGASSEDQSKVVPMNVVSQVTHGPDPAFGKLPLDGHCVTLTLDDGDCLTL